MRGLRAACVEVGAALALALLVGCTSDTGVPDDSGPFADQIAAIIEQAEVGGASEAQLEILRHAQAQGEVSLEDARTGARAAVECMTEAGLSAIYSESNTESGLVLPGYAAAWTMGDDATDALIQACDQQEGSWVNQLYQTQPSSMALQDAVNDKKDPLVRSCLEDNGYPTAEDASPSDVIAHALSVESETLGAVDCLTEAGIW